MKCAVIRDLLPLYEEGLCSENTHNAVKEHLSKCKECRGVHTIMQKAIEIKFHSPQKYPLEHLMAEEQGRNTEQHKKEPKAAKEDMEALGQGKEKAFPCLQSKENKGTREFWRKYYGSLYVKGIVFFLMMYSILIGIIWALNA